jgi:tetratricopeptide (TPR) repeat protein
MNIKVIINGVSCFVLILILSFIFLTNTVSAETKTFIKEYTYQASEDDSRNSSRTLALREVKRLLLEELGTYLESVTEVQNFKLTKDQITTLTAGIVQTEIVEEKWDGKTYWLKSKIQADSNEVIKSIYILRQDHHKTKELEEVKRRSDELLRENKRLKEELAVTKGENRKEKLKDYNKNIIDLKASEWWEKGNAFDNAGNYRDAVDSFSKAIELQPKIAGGYSYRGAVLVKLGDSIQSFKDFDKAIELDPRYAKTYLFRGFAYGKLGKQSESLKDFDKAIELDPNDAWAYNGRSIIHVLLGNLNQSLRDSDKAIDLSPKYANAYYNRGIAYLHMENKSKALNDFDKAIELNPKYVEAYLRRGIVYHHIGNYTQAIKDYDKAIEFDPKYGEAYFNRSLSYARLNDGYRLLQDMKAAARLDHKDAKDFLKEHDISW